MANLTVTCDLIGLIKKVVHLKIVSVCHGHIYYIAHR